MRIITLVILLLLTGCMEKSTPELFNPNQEVTLTVWAADEKRFMQKYGVPFNNKYPNVRVKTVVPEEGAIDWNKELARQKPDLLVVDKKQYQELANAGLLQDLEQTMADTGWELEDLFPVVPELLKDNHDGLLYGVSATLQSTALFYNAALFKKYNIPLPQPDMTWEDVYQLARRFPTGGGTERIYGYSSEHATIADQLLQLGRSSGLSAFSPDGKRLLLDSPGWKAVYAQLTAALKTGVLYVVPQSKQDPSMQYWKHPFLEGKAAMLVGRAYYGGMLTSLDKLPEWGVVNMPQHAATMGTNPDYELYEIAIIPKQAVQLGAAKAFIEYMTGEDWAILHAKSNPYELLARYELRNQSLLPGQKSEPFYALKSNTKTNEAMNKVKEEVKTALYRIIETETTKVLEGNATAERALRVIQEQGQEILSKLDS